MRGLADAAKAVVESSSPRAEGSRPPLLRIQLLSKSDDGDQGVVLNGIRVLLRSGYYDVFRVLAAEARGLSWAALGVHGSKKGRRTLASRMSEMRSKNGSKIRNPRLRDALHALQLPVPLLDPDQPRFHPKLQVVVRLPGSLP